MIAIYILSITIAYLFGSISSAIIVCRLMGLPDPRQQGSNNPGATNVLRIGGKIPALITLLGDTLKGFIPVFLGILFSLPETLIALIAFFAFIGHLYPIFFKFQGGKGVATLLGTLFAFSYPASFCWMITWAILAFSFRYSSLASLVASLLTPLFISYFTHNNLAVLLYSLMAILLCYRHRKNIENLLKGKESKLLR